MVWQIALLTIIVIWGFIFILMRLGRIADLLESLAPKSGPNERGSSHRAQKTDPQRWANEWLSQSPHIHE